MHARRVLVLGLTGVEKGQAMANLSRHCHNTILRDPEVIDFEREFLSGTKPCAVLRENFLDQERSRQHRDWNAAWDYMWDSRLRKLVEDEQRDVFLGVHGCYMRGHYGCRWILDTPRVATFKPDLIVTLIADVYDMWWTTEQRAHGEAWRGQPTLEHLIHGRRSEVMVGDQIASMCNPMPRNLVVAVGHPCETLARCIYRDATLIYMSFPISEPRNMARAGNLSGVEAISSFVRRAHAAQQVHQNIAFICPLAIDELPFSEPLRNLQFEKIDETTGEKVDLTAEFDRRLRWPLSEFWPENERLAVPRATPSPFPIKQIRDAAGSIFTDVGLRDYRLAEQASRLAVFNPVFNDRGSISRGVANEITHATVLGRPVYIYQDPAHDRKGAFNSWLTGHGGGTMGPNPMMRLINCKNSLDELMEALAN